LKRAQQRLGVYIVAVIVWLWRVEHVLADRWDGVGACIGLLGAATILFARRHAAAG
jgi:drug/metabolite transporter superfamily protein YnfA